MDDRRSEPAIVVNTTTSGPSYFLGMGFGQVGREPSCKEPETMVFPRAFAHISRESSILAGWDDQLMLEKKG